MFAGFTLLAGYQVTRNFVLSTGAGISSYNHGSLYPVFIDLRYAITLDKLSPYLFADGGLLMNGNNFDNTKVFMNPGIGAQYSVSYDLAIILSSGFWIQRGDRRMNEFVNFKAGVKYKF
jgi:hemolysin activation/secretion protein